MGTRRPFHWRLNDREIESLSDEQRDDLREFMWVLRRALYLVIRWIEKRYEWKPSTPGERLD